MISLRGEYPEDRIEAARALGCIGQEASSALPALERIVHDDGGGYDLREQKILRSLNRWDPPWKRVRKARGPPPSESSQPSSRAPAAELLDLPVEAEQYFAD